MTVLLYDGLCLSETGGNVAKRSKTPLACGWVHTFKRHLPLWEPQIANCKKMISRLPSLLPIQMMCMSVSWPEFRIRDHSVTRAPSRCLVRVSSSQSRTCKTPTPTTDWNPSPAAELQSCSTGSWRRPSSRGSGSSRRRE